MSSIAFKFVSWDVNPLETLKDSKAYILREKINNGLKLTRLEKNWITQEINNNCYSKSGIPVMGWMFDFSDVVNTFVVKQYGVWTQYNAIDKTSLRSTLYGRIERIVGI